MSYVRIVAQRVALGLAAVWAVFTVVFLLFTVVEDWYLEQLLAREARGGTTPERIEEVRTQYLAERGLDRPLPELYAEWMWNMLTLQWGHSFETGEAVRPMVFSASLRTATYVLPAMALATVLGVAIGLYVAFRAPSIDEGLLRASTYLGFGLPNFLVGAMALAVSASATMAFRRRSNAIQPTELPFLYGDVLPTLLVASTLLAAVVGYVRAYARQYATAEFVKLVRAKGGGRLAVARHVLRNVSIPLVSLAFVETFALITLSVFVVEALFGIGGLGLVFYNAVWTHDLPVMLGAIVVVVGFGVVGNVVQDVAYSALDPRVDTGRR